MLRFVVYEILNKKTGKRYIGSTIDLRKRMREHKRALARGVHYSLHLQRAYSKDGKSAFSSRVLYRCDTLEEARQIEQDYLHVFWREGSLYNVAKVVGGGDHMTDHPDRENIRRRMADSLRRRMASLSDEDRKRIHGDKIRGRKHTAEARRKISERAKLYVGEKNPMYGKSHTEETREKIRLAMLRNPSPNALAVIISGIWFESCSDAARVLGVNRMTLGYRVKSQSKKFVDYSYAGEI